MYSREIFVFVFGSADPTTYLKVQSIIDRIEETFPTVRYSMLMCNDRLLYRQVPDRVSSLTFIFL